MIKKSEILKSALFLSLCICAVLGMNQLTSLATLKLQLSSSTAGQAQVYWRRNTEEFSEQRSFRLSVPGKNRLTELNFPLGTPFIDELRIDPIDSISELKIASVKFRTAAGESEMKAALTAGNQIQNIDKENNYLKIKISGPDPQLSLRLTKNKLFICLILISGLSFFAAGCWLFKSQLREISESQNGLKYLIITSLICGFLLSVAFKLHGSSVSIWHKHYPQLMSEKNSLLAGHPHSIRSDEWMVHTPGIISQSKQASSYPSDNISYGLKMSPLLMGLPTSHFSTLFRPQYWGYFFLDTERAFSWWWNYRVFGCLIGVYLLCTLFSNGKNFYAICGSLWFYGSQFTQWWLSSGVPELVTNFSLTLFCLSCLMRCAHKNQLFAAFTGCIIFGLSFCLQIYPPFQIPLAWLGLFCLISIFFTENFKYDFYTNLKLKILYLISGMIICFSVLLIFAGDLTETAQVLAATSYPGQRSESGGTLPAARLLFGNFAFSTSEMNFPEQLGNISEAGSFLIFWPVAIFLLKSLPDIKRVIPLIAYYLLATSYCLIGWPELLSKLSLLSLVPSSRMQIGLGLSNILICIFSLTRSSALTNKSSNPTLKNNITALVSAALLTIASCYYLEKTYAKFFNQFEFIFEGSIVLLLLFSLIRARVFFLLLISLFSAVNCLRVNPLASGLPELLANKITDSAAQLPDDIKFQPMLVYGDFTLPSLFKAAGFRVINGVNYVPNLDYWKFLDPDKKFYDTYNRYAHFFYQPAESDKINLSLLQADLVRVEIDPCAEELVKAGIKLFVLPKQQYYSCLEAMNTDLVGIDIYRYHNTGTAGLPAGLK